MALHRAYACVSAQGNPARRRAREATMCVILRSLAPTTLLFLGCALALAEKQYGPGATDSEIRIGQTTAYSGPASTYSTIARTQLAYFDKINAEGGVNGRRIKLISLDDGYQPPKTVEQTRK